MSPSEEEALVQALQDEYKAWSVYEQVIAKFGDVRPFTSIQKAEENHIAALLRLFDAYGLEAPSNEWLDSDMVSGFNTVGDACAGGVDAEIANAAVYDGLFSKEGLNEYPDIIQVFNALKQASLSQHLPAFERCATP